MFRRRAPPSSSAGDVGLSLRAAASSLSSEVDRANGVGAAPSYSSSPVLIQRLIILHDGLMPLPPSRSRGQIRRRRNPQAMLSEDASLEEHGEFILYYYDHSLHYPRDGSRRRPPPEAPTGKYGRRGSFDYEDYQRHGSNGSFNSSSRSLARERPPADHATEEAVRFAGICRALRSLPQALQPQHRHEDGNSTSCDTETSETDVVHLKDSTLVFAPLELCGDIVCVAQIPRGGDSRDLSHSRGSHRGFGADPSAVKEAMRHVHASFSLLFGGGIHKRLLRTKHLEKSKSWVLEVIEDTEREDDNASSLSESGRSERLKRKDDSNWEMGVPVQEAQVEAAKDTAGKPKKSTRRKSTRSRKKLFAKLSGSFNMGSSFNSANSEEGSVHSNNKDDISGYVGDYRYGGMEELFGLRREHRKLSNQLQEDAPPDPADSGRGERFGGLGGRQNSRWGRISNAEDLFDDIANDVGHNDCERRIDRLLAMLPITGLREDLEKFYDEWLFRAQGVCEVMQGGVGRCVVDMIPSPIRIGGNSSLEDEPVRGQHPPSSPSPFVCLAAAEFIKSLLREDLPMGRHGGSRLSGLSVFHRDRLVLSETKFSNERRSMSSFPSEIPCMIVEYFSSCQKKQAEEDAALNDASRQKIDASETPMSKWFSMGPAKSEESVGDDIAQSGRSDKSAANGDAISGYVAHPSSSKDSNSPSNSIFLRSVKKHVWLQRVHLPAAGADNVGSDDEMETYVAIFESKELSFLLFFEMPSLQGEEGTLARMAEEIRRKSRKNGSSNKAVRDATQAFVDTLLYLSDKLAEFCGTYCSHEVDESIPPEKNMAPTKEINSDRVFPGEPGIDIICIDRDESSFILMSQHDLSSNEFKRAEAKSPSDGPKQKLGLFGMGARPKDAGEQGMSTQYSNMLDCRHKLAAYLPLDVMLAFDDMFNEIGRSTGRRTWSDNAAEGANTHHVNDGIIATRSIELCTFLPQGWVYARAFGSVELYILLDTSRFVTINDVQKAVTRVRERVFNDRIR